MNRASFNERLWDLQQRKQGAERLKMRLEAERIFIKLHLNSVYGKIGYRKIDDDPKIWYEYFYKEKIRYAEIRQELGKLAREFRPF